MKKAKIIEAVEMGTSPADIIPSLNQRDRGIYEFRIQGIPYKEIQIALSASPNQIAFIDKYLIKKQFDISEPAKPDTFTSDAVPESIESSIKPDTITSDAVPESIESAIKSDTITSVAVPKSIEAAIKSDTIPSDAVPESIESAIKSDTIPSDVVPESIESIIKSAMNPDVLALETKQRLKEKYLNKQPEPTEPAPIIQNKELPVTPPETIVPGRDSVPFGFMARRRKRIRKRIRNKK